MQLLGRPRDPRACLLQRAQLATAARKEMEQAMAQARVARALRHQVPSASAKSFCIGDWVLIWRERVIANRIGE